MYIPDASIEWDTQSNHVCRTIYMDIVIRWFWCIEKAINFENVVKNLIETHEKNSTK